nr:hypothetical protein [Desulfobacterales bacterium]
MIKEIFGRAIQAFVESAYGSPGLTGVCISRQFQPGEERGSETWRNLNAAFLVALCGRSHPRSVEGEKFIKELGNRPGWKEAARFYDTALHIIRDEVEEVGGRGQSFRDNLKAFTRWISNPRNLSDRRSAVERAWKVFFPEGVSLADNDNREAQIGIVRKRRAIDITRLNPSPIKDPAREILFASNVLLTVPGNSSRLSSLNLPEQLKTALDEIEKEPQLYWYDHPIPVGIRTEKNELVYGLKGFDSCVGFEKSRGTIPEEARVARLLSVSVTHEGLQNLARPLVMEMFRGVGRLRHIDVYVWTESETRKLVYEILAPASRHFLDFSEGALLEKIIGVNGEYGRHYSFLRAIATFWHLLFDPSVKATFKIDLDQVFPQEELVRETGVSALEHFKTPLWGAEGVDSNGRKVELGMIAGAVVNKEDIGSSLFIPDVKYPGEHLEADEWIFFSRLPQAVSTEAEMMTRYRGNEFDGIKRCIQRVHVTGGTCGILVKILRKYRPFTPTFIGRAEDQAYLVGVLFHNSGGFLRYVHKDGLIMRHDKEAFAREAIEAAKTGKLVGDLVRLVLFTYYAGHYPGL